jgi:hypothetical protein
MTYQYPETELAGPEDLDPADRERYDRCVGIWQAVSDIQCAVSLLLHELDLHGMAPPQRASRHLPESSTE